MRSWRLSTRHLIRSAASAGLSAGVAIPAATATDNQIRKLDKNGQPADGDQMITPVVVHRGLIYIAGQGANDLGSVAGMDISAHTRKTLDNVKRLVEAGGGTMESILQLTVFLATLEDYEAMNKVYYGEYFPHGGPKRTTVAVTGVPGQSLVEMNCIAAVVR